MIGEQVRCKVWRPDGPPYYVLTCSTHEEIAGSLVADGMPEAEYWPTVVAGYRAVVRWHGEQVHLRRAKEYAAGWIERYTDDLDILWGRA